ncbi:hypothetical protein EON62_04205, partial [archaeon]
MVLSSIFLTTTPMDTPFANRAFLKFTTAPTGTTSTGARPGRKSFTSPTRPRSTGRRVQSVEKVETAAAAAPSASKDVKQRSRRVSGDRVEQTAATTAPRSSRQDAQRQRPSDGAALAAADRARTSTSPGSGAATSSLVASRRATQSHMQFKQSIVSRRQNLRRQSITAVGVPGGMGNGLPSRGVVMELPVAAGDADQGAGTDVGASAMATPRIPPSIAGSEHGVAQPSSPPATLLTTEEHSRFMLAFALTMHQLQTKVRARDARVMESVLKRVHLRRRLSLTSLATPVELNDEAAADMYDLSRGVIDYGRAVALLPATPVTVKVRRRLWWCATLGGSRRCATFLHRVLCGRFPLALSHSGSAEAMKHGSQKPEERALSPSASYVVPESAPRRDSTGAAAPRTLVTSASVPNLVSVPRLSSRPVRPVRFFADEPEQAPDVDAVSPTSHVIDQALGLGGKRSSVSSQLSVGSATAWQQPGVQ